MRREERRKSIESVAVQSLWYKKNFQCIYVDLLQKLVLVSFKHSHVFVFFFNDFDLVTNKFLLCVRSLNQSYKLDNIFVIEVA